jgi:hypothetical protein
MEESPEIVKDIKKKPSRRRYIIPAFIPFLIIVALFGSFLKWKSEPDPSSEKLIRQIAAEQLKKAPNELTDEDFAKITQLSFINQDVPVGQRKKIELYDIKLLKKFVNLQVLDLSGISYPKPDIPKWMVALAKMHVFNLQKKYQESYMEKYLIDLSPLANLSKLQILDIKGTPIKDLQPLAKIESLKEIHLLDKQLDELDLFHGGAVPKTVSINNKAFKLEMVLPWPPYKNKDADSENIKNSLPKVISYMQGTWGSPLDNIKIDIMIEVDKALK